MGRPPLVLGTWGRITRAKRGSAWVASARFRDFDGVTRQVERRGATGRQAEDALVEHLRDRTRTHGADLSGDTKTRELAAQWFEVIEQQGRAASTLETYRRSLRVNVLPALGDVRLREATVPVIDRYVSALTKSAGYGQAKTARVVLNGMFGLAVRHGAVASNPVRETEAVSVPRSEVRTVGVDEVLLLRERLAHWDADVDKAGNTRVSDLGPVVDMLLATGVRTGEVLAIRWSDLVLDDKHSTVEVSGTVIEITGHGLTRQSRTKTASSSRRLVLPPFAVAMLVTRARTSDYVFPSSVGTLRSPSNMRRQWRDFRREHGYAEWITPKTFRKAVATLIRDDLDLDTAAAQLGHSSTAVTRTHYAAPLAEGPDVTAILAKFAG